ncbi:endoplasmic reticulum aminopeptidase 2 isoform X2 [Brachionus plicatilis]|uniref:Aminopeptidase n=1 Tax=Brachionus plicatilis TaxID=10195 RepID=A0A3M7SLJ6_BRAPC|nr:endoplasmic reticulum aminopeptidase 2 isoform X2 [Brachionus plicatilis]
MNISKRKGLNVSLPVLIVGIVSGLCVILLIGLVSGLVLRPENCTPKANSSTTSVPTATTSKLSISSTTSTSTISRSNLTLPSTTTRPFVDRTTTPMFDFRLIDVAQPKKYDLLFKFYTDPYGSSSKESKNFDGEVNIFFQVKRPASRIELHIDIEVVVQNQAIQLTNSDTNQEVKIVRSGYLPNQLFEVIAEQELNEANYNIKIQFSGRTKTAGMYQANYLEDNLPRELIATNFLPTNARSVFPCFDEPSYKAEFEITIEHPERSIALSNFPKQSSEVFSESALPPKIVFLAVPDFNDDTSKNWGLSTFHEEFLLTPETDYSVKDEIIIAKKIANELAHFWTGGYITPTWWDDWWLSEGFSTFFEYEALNELFPDFKMRDEFINDHVIPIMWDDGFVSSRPIKFDVSSQIDIKFMFEQLTTSKSAAVVRMLKSIVGDQEFKKNIKNFLSQHPYGSVTTYDFYLSFNMSNVIPTTTEDFVDRWILQQNYPEVAVLIENRSGRTRVNFVQARFLLSQIQEEDPDLITSPYNYKWEIYLDCQAGGEFIGDQANHVQGMTTQFKFFLTGDRDFVDLDRVYTWVKCNKDFNGFYITDYRNELFEAFEAILLHDMTVFSDADRSNLIHNAFELAFLGSKSYQIAALLSNYLTDKETSPSPFRTFFWHVKKIASISEHRSSFKNLRSFILEMLADVLNRLGLDIWDNSGDESIRNFKIDLIDLECRMQSEKCLNKATGYYEEISEDFFLSPSDHQLAIPNELRPLVFKYHSQNTYEINDWINIFEFYENTNNVREREYALEALGNTRQTFLLDL